MKKILAAAAALALLMSLAACGQNGGSTVTESQTEAASVTESATETTVPSTKGADRLIEMDSYDVTVPGGWAIQKMSNDPDSLVAFTIADASKVEADTPRVSIDVIKGVKNGAEFKTFIADNSAKQGENIKISDKAYFTATYTSDDIEYLAYQGQIGDDVIRIIKCGATEDTDELMDTLISSISFK